MAVSVSLQLCRGTPFVFNDVFLKPLKEWIGTYTMSNLYPFWCSVVARAWAIEGRQNRWEESTDGKSIYSSMFKCSAKKYTRFPTIADYLVFSGSIRLACLMPTDC